MYPIRARNRGYSIVSILVAMAISLFLLTGVLTVYLNGNSTFAHQGAVAAATENGRFAIEDLRRALFMTGRGLLPSQSPFPAVGTELFEGGSGNSDGLAVIYARGMDCSGAPVTALSRQAFSLGVGVDGNSTLYCSVDGGAIQPLVSGIEWMQVLYGVDDDADGVANRYLDATEVETDSLWGNVVSLRVGLVVSSGDFAVPASARDLTPANISLLGETFTPADDSLLYKTITTTIMLRNLTIVER